MQPQGFDADRLLKVIGRRSYELQVMEEVSAKFAGTIEQLKATVEGLQKDVATKDAKIAELEAEIDLLKESNATLAGVAETPKTEMSAE